MHKIIEFIGIGVTTIAITTAPIRSSRISTMMEEQLEIQRTKAKIIEETKEELPPIEEIEVIEVAVEEHPSRGIIEEPQYINYQLTFYCSCSHCSGEWGTQTASGMELIPYITCAADKSYPFGTKIYIEGFGELTVVDRGGAVKGNVLDVYVSDHQEALRLGRQYKRGYIIK